jgi:hypothetical protein
MNIPVRQIHRKPPQQPDARCLQQAAIAALRDCVARHQAQIPGLAEVAERLQGADSLDTLLSLYEDCHPLLERAMWSGAADFHALLATYQSLFREQEALIRQRCKNDPVSDDRHHFILGIPVADRPPHLRACLESIYQVCTLFDYGGHASGAWDRIQVVVAEDSRDETNVRRHQELVEEYRQKGLQVIYFGLA